MAIGTGRITVAIGANMLEIDTAAECEIHDVSEDMDTVSARIAFFGELLAAASSEAISIDAAYRNWRAAEALKALKVDSKVSEWKVRAEIEATETFKKYKEALAKAEYNETALKVLIKGLEEKSPNLRSKGARQRAELDSTAMSTSSTEQIEINKEALRKLAEERKQNAARKGK